MLLSYPENAFGEAKALRVFISTRTELSAQEILSLYANRWSIEVFFRGCKQKLAFDKCQLRKEKGITRMWLILSFVRVYPKFCVNSKIRCKNQSGLGRRAG